MSHLIPEDGWKGFGKYWRNDLIAAFSVSFVALPLCLGIALAAGLPPMSGVISAVVGSFVTTFVRGSHVSINGPGAGLIAVVLAAVAGLEDGSGRTLHFVLAAFVVSGAIQVLLGLFKLGKFADLFPSSVIHGILAAIGLIIIAKQIHVALGTSSDADNTIGIIMDAFRNFSQINPFIALISVVGILLLVFHARISYKLFHFIPAPMWVLVIAVILVYVFNFLEPHSISLWGNSYPVGPQYLISIPDNPLDALFFPDFSKTGSLKFWLAVVSITLISSVETLASAKAVDKLDPYKRKTNLNKELVGVGLGTMASGALGGLPVLTVIVRSTVNLHNNASTRWSNLYHGLLILIFVLLLAPVIQKVPLAALAAILVYTGFKLVSPRNFAMAYKQGMEQLLFLVGTMVITLYTNLLWGIVGGTLLTLLVHILLARVPIQDFFHMIRLPDSGLGQRVDGKYELKLKGVVNFLSLLKINKMLASLPAGSDVEVDLSASRLVDLTVLENLDDFQRAHENTGGSVSVGGTDRHVASADHRLALKSHHHSPAPVHLSKRELKMQLLSIENDWEFQHKADLDHRHLKSFHFFELRPIEKEDNIIKGKFSNLAIGWQLSDITFDEGAFTATEVYHTTIQVIRLPKKIPAFVIEQEGFFDKLFDRVMAFTGQMDIDFQLFPDFSSKFLLKGDDEAAIRTFFTPELIRFLEVQNIHHIESNGEALLIFRYLRLARTGEIVNMLEFSERLVKKIMAY